MKNKIVFIIIFFAAAGASSAELKITKEEPLEITAKTVKANNRTKEIVYTGNVTLKHAGNILMAEKVTLVQESDKIIAEKNVIFDNKENTFEMTGNYIEYFKNNKFVLMKDSPVLYTKDKDDIEAVIRGEKMEMYSEGGKVVVTGNVQAMRQDMKVYCGVAEYDRKTEKILLTEKPVVRKGEDRYEGDKITIFTKTRNLMAETNVKAQIFIEGKKQ